MTKLYRLMINLISIFMLVPLYAMDPAAGPNLRAREHFVDIHANCDHGHIIGSDDGRGSPKLPKGQDSLKQGGHESDSSAISDGSAEVANVSNHGLVGASDAPNNGSADIPGIPMEKVLPKGWAHNQSFEGDVQLLSSDPLSFELNSLESQADDTDSISQLISYELMQKMMQIGLTNEQIDEAFSEMQKNNPADYAALRAKLSSGDPKKGVTRGMKLGMPAPDRLKLEVGSPSADTPISDVESELMMAVFKLAYAKAMDGNSSLSLELKSTQSNLADTQGGLAETEKDAQAKKRQRNVAFVASVIIAVGQWVATKFVTECQACPACTCPACICSSLFANITHG